MKQRQNLCCAACKTKTINLIKEHTQASEETIGTILGVMSDMIRKGAPLLAEHFLKESVLNDAPPTDEELLDYVKRWEENWETVYWYVMHMKEEGKTV